jgi:CDP-glucose 4,6-dehydratase
MSYGNIWQGLPVFMTGHTGFKGSWLGIWLHSLGARVAGYSLGIPTVTNNFASSGVGDLLERH